MVRTSLYLASALSLSTSIFATAVPGHHANVARQQRAVTSAASVPSAAVAPAASSTSTPVAAPLGTITAGTASTASSGSTGTATVTSGSARVTGSTSVTLSGYTGIIPAGLASIGTATTSEITQTLPSTYAAGATGPVKGAPPLPAITSLNPANYPPLDRQPPTNSSQVLRWIQQINLAGAPDIPVSGMGGCLNTTYNAALIANAGPSGNCWWTCGGCTRASDISFCPAKNTWGLSYDDGPSPYTPRLLNLLNARNIKATFFVVGSRCISRPQMLQTEYMQGHQISVHTWAHPYLTTMTNEQIVAELGWTKKVIKDVTGVTPNTMRPPYGDIDDRVRYISLQMGLTPIIWTSYQKNTFDTRDWQIGAGVVNATSVYANFENYLGLATTSLTTGFIVLAHDLYQQSVELAVTYILPEVFSAKLLTMQPIITCLGADLSEAYVETSDNSSLPIETTMTRVGASGTGFVANVAQTSYTQAPLTAPTGSTSASGGKPNSSSSLRISFGGLLATALGFIAFL